MYGIQRKIGVGFNHPRVLRDYPPPDWRAKYDFARRLTRLRPVPRGLGKLPPSLIDTMAKYFCERNRGRC